MKRFIVALATGAWIGAGAMWLYDDYHPRCVVANSYTSGNASTVPLTVPSGSDSVQWAPYGKDGAHYQVQTPVPNQPLTIGPTQTKTGIDDIHNEYTSPDPMKIVPMPPAYGLPGYTVAWNQSPHTTISTDLLVNRANTDVAWEKLTWRSFAVDNNSVELAGLSVKDGKVVYVLAGQRVSRAAFYQWLDSYVLSGMKAHSK